MQQDPGFGKEKEKVGCQRGWDSLAEEIRKEVGSCGGRGQAL